MGVLAVPWGIGQAGVKHSAEVARAVAYASSNGSDGVIGSTDLRINATPTPGSRVTLMPGAVNMVSRYSGVVGQAYVGVVNSLDYITIDPTTSAGGRSDLIIARVRDPQYGSVSGYDPANPNNFKFFTIEVVKGVASGTKRLYGHNYPGVALARIDIPSSTATITAGMITDLRQMSNRKTDRQVRPAFPSGDLNIPTTGYRAWPGSTVAMFDVPLWATRAVVTTHISSIEYIGNGRTVAGVRGVFGTLTDTENTIIVQSTAGRFQHTHVSSFNLTSGFRGIDVGYQLQGYRTYNTGMFQLDYQSSLVFDATFLETVE